MSNNRYDTARLNAIEFSLVAERYGRVKRVGANLYAECPWHDDRNPSLLIGGRKGNFCHCFSCGKSGSVIDYVMALKNCGFKEACELLHQDFGIPFLEVEGIRSKVEGQGAKVKGHGAKVKGQGSKVKGQGAKVGRKRLSLYEIMRKEQEMIDSEVGRLKRKREWEQREDFCYIPMEYLEGHVGGENAFFNCLRTIFTEEGVQWLIREYRLGTWPHPNPPQRRGDACRVGMAFVMFPSIDVEGRVHNIKIQRYCDDKDSDRFFHKLDKSTFWLGSILAKRHPELFSQHSRPDGLPVLSSKASQSERLWGSGGLHFDSTCFFGEHLLPMYPDMPVVLVESPKNAIIGAGEATRMLWIAAGNKGNLTRRRLECLRNRKVIVIPDNDAVEEWRAILSKMGDIATFVMSSFCTDALINQGEKGDVADYLIKKLGPL